MNAEGYGLTVGFFPDDSFDVHDVFQTVDRYDFTLAPFVGASSDEDLVVFTNRD